MNYGNLNIGDLFSFPNHNKVKVIYMKISHEKDHCYSYVCWEGNSRGTFYLALDDNDEVVLENGNV